MAYKLENELSVEAAKSHISDEHGKVRAEIRELIRLEGEAEKKKADLLQNKPAVDSKEMREANILALDIASYRRDKKVLEGVEQSILDAFTIEKTEFDHKAAMVEAARLCHDENNDLKTCSAPFGGRIVPPGTYIPVRIGGRIAIARAWNNAAFEQRDGKDPVIAPGATYDDSKYATLVLGDAQGVLPSAPMYPIPQRRPDILNWPYMFATKMRHPNGRKMPIPAFDDTRVTTVAYTAGTSIADGMNPKFADLDVEGHLFRTGLLPVAIDLNQDSALPMFNHMMGILDRAQQRGMETAILTGNGTDPNPHGMIPGIQNSVQNRTAGAYEWEDFVKWMQSPDMEYLMDGAVFLLSKTLRDPLMLLEDGQGRPLLFLDLRRDGMIAPGMGGSMFGHQVGFSTRMGTEAVGQTIGIFGPLKDYLVYDVDLELTFIFDSESDTVGTGVYKYQRQHRMDGRWIGGLEAASAGVKPTVDQNHSCSRFVRK